MKFCYALTLWVTGLLLSLNTSAQDLSNKGKDFWIGYGNHVRMMGGNATQTMQLYITSDVNTSGKVEIASLGISQSFSVTANNIVAIDIDNAAALRDHGLYDHGIHVTAKDPVVVYSFIYQSAVSGATVCLPTNTLGREYYSVNFDQQSNENNNSHSYFFVIAADTGTTTVEITPSVDTKIGQQANTPFLVNLKQGQIYQVMGALKPGNNGRYGYDLTGSRIRSLNNGSGCKKIAVYCGSGKISIGCDAPNSSDNLYQQMYPVNTWGKKYITIPGLVNVNNHYRIVKSDVNAVVKLNGTIIDPALFNNNFYYQFSSSKTNVIESDKPILVAQYFTTQGCSGNKPITGDPEMIYLNPVEQTVKNVTLTSMQPAQNTQIREHYLNVLVKNDPAAISSFKIDGYAYSNFSAVPGDNAYAYAQIPTFQGTHNIQCDSGFNIIAYGFGDHESYGYSGGTNLKDLYQFASIKNDYAELQFPSTCTDAPFNLSMTFPYEPLRIEYKFNGLFPDEKVDKPVADSSWLVNGRRLYLYKLSKKYTVSKAGNYPLNILAWNPTPDGCEGLQEIQYELKVYEKPIAKFSWNGGRCEKDVIQFKDNSGTQERPIQKYFWDFNTGDTSMKKDPSYAFAAFGKYKVRMKFISDIGCLSAEDSSEIIINPNPVASFTTEGPYCNNNDVVLKDISVIGKGRIAEWNWSLGEGTIVKNTTAIPVSFRYKNTGPYKTALLVRSDSGCVSKQLEKNIEIHPAPVVLFDLPENCISDPFSLFVNKSTVADKTESQFTYAWNFGDGNALPQDNVSGLKNPKHKYSSKGLYDVKLKVTTNNLCTDSLFQPFYINGATPKSSFEVINGTQHCSNDSVRIKNNSTVDFGRITKVEIYWDYQRDQSMVTIDEEPTNGEQYANLYKEFFAPLSKDVEIRVIAYSGQSCVSTTSQLITMKATPDIHFPGVQPVCGNFSSFSLNASLNNVINGSGIYSGKGITSMGFFTPSVAGAGDHIIRYTYGAANGCSNYEEQVATVYPIPTVNAGPDKYCLEGGTVMLEAQANGATNYSWYPSDVVMTADPAKPYVAPLEDISYSLTVINDKGCTASDDVLVKVLKMPVVPNAFSPNGDGIHDTWVIPYLDTYPGATIELFNRYGQPVFRLASYRPWDGKVNGVPLPVGTYYYIINPKNGRKQITGFVDLIR